VKILVVDDDPMVQQVCQGMLRALNHSSIVVGDATTAIEHLTDSSQPFDCIILDNGLPRLSGMELLAVLREWNMSVPVILISGSSPIAQSNDVGTKPSQFEFLAKPFTLSDLKAAIERSQA
jgi:DNA-binding NtrC family response regulator